MKNRVKKQNLRTLLFLVVAALSLGAATFAFTPSSGQSGFSFGFSSSGFGDALCGGSVGLPCGLAIDTSLWNILGITPPNDCEVGACGSSCGLGDWYSGAYPNGNDPNDLNLFTDFAGDLWNAFKQTIFGKQTFSSLCRRG